jgi:hypothetical protein
LPLADKHSLILQEKQGENYDLDEIMAQQIKNGVV